MLDWSSDVNCLCIVFHLALRSSHICYIACYNDTEHINITVFCQFFVCLVSLAHDLRISEAVCNTSHVLIVHF